MPRGEEGMTDAGVGVVAGGKNPLCRKREDSAIKDPVRPMPAEQPTRMGGSRSSYWSTCVRVIDDEGSKFGSLFN